VYFEGGPARKEKEMKKITQMKVLNALLGLLMISQALSGLLHDRLAEETFEHVHILGGLLIVIGVILHLVLNWGWVRMNYLRKPKGD
jgi:undecaprenyl pyrophosphate phosphatase UppP